jgi:hypothetical protein
MIRLTKTKITLYKGAMLINHCTINKINLYSIIPKLVHLNSTNHPKVAVTVDTSCGIVSGYVHIGNSIPSEIFETFYSVHSKKRSQSQNNYFGKITWLRHVSMFITRNSKKDD